MLFGGEEKKFTKLYQLFLISTAKQTLKTKSKKSAININTK